MNRLMSTVSLLVLCAFSNQAFAYESWLAYQGPQGGGVNVRTTYPQSHAAMGPSEVVIQARFHELARLLERAGFQERHVENIGGRDFSSGKKLGRDCQITLEYLYDHDKRQYNPGNRISCTDGKTAVLLPPMQNIDDVRKIFDRFQEVYKAAPGKSK